jgi:hypothetical protein
MTIEDVPDRIKASTAFRAAAGVMAVLAFGAGAAVGFQGAIRQTRGGFEGAFGYFSVVVIVGVAVLVLGIAGVLLRALRRTRPLARITRLATGAVVVGALGGALVVPVLGLRYTPPVTTMIQGSATLVLTGAVDFIPASAGAAECRTVPDGQEIEAISVYDLGTLRGMPLGAQIQPGVTSGDQSIALLVEDQGGPEPVAISWGASLQVPSTGGGRAGSVVFTDVALEVDPKTGAPDASWPRTLTGTLSWTCN